MLQEYPTLFSVCRREKVEDGVYLASSYFEVVVVYVADKVGDIAVKRMLVDGY